MNLSQFHLTFLLEWWDAPFHFEALDYICAD